jgi:hypothetical protein
VRPQVIPMLGPWAQFEQQGLEKNAKEAVFLFGSC